eukprot:SAG22_NODE_248_length_13909_cov_141.345112_4_plen_88_part_00
MLAKTSVHSRNWIESRAILNTGSSYDDSTSRSYNPHGCPAGTHSVIGTGHGPFGGNMPGSQGSTSAIKETIIFRYRQAIPTHIITLK